ncbi:FAD-dependent monooxygenase [Citricoccus nitrophenolicus]|uniref:FAD binding domain-containing protein n=1 Tax=Citricoccus nitrophenolicus TaxID=863575 RepID=UPI0039B3AF96
MSGTNERVAVVGGSIAGLTAALNLRDAGVEVDIYERSPQPLSGYGTGIVVQPELVRYLVEQGIELESLSVPSTSMAYVDARTGNSLGTIPSAHRFTSYNTVYGQLLKLFSMDRYHNNKCLVGLDQDSDVVRMRFSDGTRAEADWLIAADGGASVVRKRLLGIEPQYAGYVTWRGLLQPGEVADEIWDYFDGKFTYGLLDDGHLIAYPIPGGEGKEASLLNFQWYWNVQEGPELDELMTDIRGTRLSRSVHNKSLIQHNLSQLHDRAQELAGPFRDLVLNAPSPFVTVVADATVDQMVHGRVVLIGDAAVTPRPHAAAGGAKACDDARTLAEVLGRGDDLSGSLQRWESRQLQQARAYVRKAQEMGSRLQSGGLFEPGDPNFAFGLPQVSHQSAL